MLASLTTMTSTGLPSERASERAGEASRLFTGAGVDGAGAGTGDGLGAGSSTRACGVAFSTAGSGAGAEGGNSVATPYITRMQKPRKPSAARW